MTLASFIRIWGWPILLGMLTAAGLVSALVSEARWASVVSWIGLGLPVVVILRHWPLGQISKPNPRRNLTGALTRKVHK